MRSVTVFGLTLACLFGLCCGIGFGGYTGYGNSGGGNGGGSSGILVLLFLFFILFFNKSDSNVKAINILPPPQTGLG